MKFIASLSRIKRNALTRLKIWTSNEAYFTYCCIYALALIGLWPGKKMGMQSLRSALIRAITALALYFSLVTLPVGIYVNRARGINILIEQIACFFLFFTLVIYFWCFNICSDKTEKVVKSMESMLQCGRLYNNRPQSIKRETKKWSDVSFGLLLFYHFTSITLISLQVPYHRSRKIFQFNGWFPDIFTEQPGYELMLITTTIFFLSGGMIIINSIIFVVSLFIQAIGQLKLLNHHLPLVLSSKPIGRKRKVKYPLLKHYTNEALNRTMSQPLQKIKLCHCIRHHQKIISFVGSIQDTFQLMLLNQCIACIIPIGLAIILLTYATEYDLKIIMILAIILITTVNFALFSLLADLTSEQSALVKDSIFACNWIDSSPSFQRSVRIIILRANQPIGITVAGFVPITIQQFVKIIRISYSYYISITSCISVQRYTFRDNIIQNNP